MYIVICCYLCLQDTDTSLEALDLWPTQNPQFKSKASFQRILVEHRAAVNATDVAYRGEMTYYSDLISGMMNWSVSALSQD